MNYRAFGDFRKGYAHVKNGSDVEDYASSYNDGEGRFYVGVICDGHSDKNCFRSGKGARFGCESAVEILKKFFELYFSQNEKARTLPNGFEDRLKRSLKLCWDRKVYHDIQENPLEEEELKPLTERVRKIYQAGNGLLNIYGATFLAIGICEDFFIALHIGDGIILCINEDGTCYSPVEQDAKSDTGAPASLCDTDLFSRENAFRISVLKKLPQLAVVSSDGIEDCMDSFEYNNFLYSLFKKIELDEEAEQSAGELNEKQKKYFAGCLEYFAGRGIGAEDDCSLAAVYDLTRKLPELRVPYDEAVEIWNKTMQERNNVVRDYENRKSGLLENMNRVCNSAAFEGHSGMSQWIETHAKLEEQKDTLKNMIGNEKEKVAFYEKKLAFYARYIDDLSEKERESVKLPVQQIDETWLLPDEEFARLKMLYQDYRKKFSEYETLKKDLENADSAINDAYEEAKRRAKLDEDDEDVTDSMVNEAKKKYKNTKSDCKKALDEYEEAKKLYQQNKNEYFRNRTKDTMNFQSQNTSDSEQTGTGTEKSEYAEKNNATSGGCSNSLMNEQMISDDMSRERRNFWIGFNFWRF